MCSSLTPIRLAALLGIAALSGVFTGCTDDPTPNPPPACPADDLVRGVCAGVPPADVCSTDPCTEGVTCASVVAVSSQAALDSALASAGVGSCIALAAGSYGAAKLPGGVSLLGRSAATVKVGQVTVGGGQGAVVRGLTIGSGGLSIEGATGVRIDRVRVTGSGDSGANVQAGSSIAFVQSEIRASNRYGLVAADGSSVTLERTVVAGNQGPGVWMACAAQCGCTSQPTLTAKSSVLYDNRIAGIALIGATGMIDSVDIKRTKPGDMWHYGEGGGGLSVAGCSTVDAKRVKSFDNAQFGVLVDESNLELGGTGAGEGFEVSNNLMGVWIQNISKTMPQSVKIEQGLVTANSGIGIAISGEAHGILVICKTAISGTVTAVLPVYQNGMPGQKKEVGDGLNWLDGSVATIEDLSLSGNARASLLIDGPVSGNLTNVTQTGGDEQKGIVQQNYTSGAQPTVGANVPPLTTKSTEVFAVPAPPTFAKTLP